MAFPFDFRNLLSAGYITISINVNNKRKNFIIKTSARKHTNSLKIERECHSKLIEREPILLSVLIRDDKCWAPKIETDSKSDSLGNSLNRRIRMLWNKVFKIIFWPLSERLNYKAVWRPFAKTLCMKRIFKLRHQ